MITTTSYYVITGIKPGQRRHARREIKSGGQGPKAELMAEYERLKRLGYNVRAKLVTTTEEPIDWASDPDP